MYSVLLAEDEIITLEERLQIIEDLGYKCFTALDGINAIKIINNEHPNVVLADIKLPHKDGFEILKTTKKSFPHIPVILNTGFGSVYSAVKAMKLGAYDYIQKPVSPEEIKVVLNNAINYQKMDWENVAFRSKIRGKYQLNNMIGESTLMQDIANRVRKAAKSDANIFIYGETGTGKELIARNIHSFSRRSDQPFIPLDCVALPETLIESEVFGYERGAFTGAINAKPGLLELADGGTLFLDEITELDINLQAKFLRVFQEFKFRRVGGTKTINSNIRIVSATNVEPQKAIELKKLRQDLYYRLNVVLIELPPLRERKEDIPHLVYHFFNMFNPSCPREIKGISKEAMNYLINYDWPGNVRELQNTIEQAMSMSENSIIGIDDFTQKNNNINILFEEEADLNLNLKEIKEKYINQIYKKYILNLLKHFNGNISKVARKANVSRITIYRILKNIDNE